jgi:hypothetical protein
MTINQATLILDEYASGQFPKDDISLARVVWALNTVYKAANQGGTK